MFGFSHVESSLAQNSGASHGAMQWNRFKQELRVPLGR